MRPGVARKPWDPDRPRKAPVGTKWKRIGGLTLDEDPRRSTWTVTGVWVFEVGGGKNLFAVTIEDPGGGVRHMSEARLVGKYRQVVK